MPVRLVVELERLGAEAALSRARLGEIGRTIESCRERLQAALAHPPIAPTAPGGAGADGTALDGAGAHAPEFDPTWGQGPA